MVCVNYCSGLGVRKIFGRLLGEEDARAGATPDFLNPIPQPETIAVVRAQTGKQTRRLIVGGGGLAGGMSSNPLPFTAAPPLHKTPVAKSGGNR